MIYNHEALATLPLREIIASLPGRFLNRDDGELSRIYPVGHPNFEGIDVNVLLAAFIYTRVPAEKLLNLPAAGTPRPFSWHDVLTPNKTIVFPELLALANIGMQVHALSPNGENILQYGIRHRHKALVALATAYGYADSFTEDEISELCAKENPTWGRRLPDGVVVSDLAIVMDREPGDPKLGLVHYLVHGAYKSAVKWVKSNTSMPMFMDMDDISEILDRLKLVEGMRWNNAVAKVHSGAIATLEAILEHNPEFKTTTTLADTLAKAVAFNTMNMKANDFAAGAPSKRRL